MAHDRSRGSALHGSPWSMVSFTTKEMMEEQQDSDSSTYTNYSCRFNIFICCFSISKSFEFGAWYHLYPYFLGIHADCSWSLMLNLGQQNCANFSRRSCKQTTHMSQLICTWGSRAGSFLTPKITGRSHKWPLVSQWVFGLPMKLKPLTTHMWLVALSLMFAYCI